MTKPKPKPKLTEPAEPPPFEAWQHACNTYAAEILPALGDLWTEDDPYDLFETAQEAFESGQSPKAFINEMFEEDLDRQKYDDDLATEALEHEADEEEEGEDE